MSGDRPFDGAFDAKTGLVMTDASNMAFVLLVDYDGTCDMKAGDGISRQQAATWLRQAADSLDPAS